MDKAGFPYEQWSSKSLVANGDNLKHFLSSISQLPDIICVKDTFLWPESNFKMNGYTVLHQDRRISFDDVKCPRGLSLNQMYISRNIHYRGQLLKLVQ